MVTETHYKSLQRPTRLAHVEIRTDFKRASVRLIMSRGDSSNRPCLTPSLHSATLLMEAGICAELRLAYGTGSGSAVLAAGASVCSARSACPSAQWTCRLQVRAVPSVEP